MTARKKRANPSIGSKFRRRFKGSGHLLEIVKSDGKIAYKVNSVLYGSPTAAARAVTNTQVNGWRFWGIG